MAHDPHHATLDRLLTTVRGSYPETDTDNIVLAYDVACAAHTGQKRVAGEDFIAHPLRVAQYLAELKLDIPTIAACILHDILEDTPYTRETLEKNFGKEISDLVTGVTVLGKLKYQGVERYIENLRKMFVAMTQDLRVIFIKFADRIDNLRTLHVWPREKQLRIAQETIEIYAPIANRLGLGHIKGELEDLAFPYINPEAYTWTKNLFLSLSPRRERYLKAVQDILRTELKKHDIEPVDLHGRTKHLYSLYQKLLKYDRDVSRIHDLVTVRVVVRTVAECYAVLGIIHKMWKPLKGRIKDYIATPKPNGYQSLHTTVFCEQEETVEIQIRTQKMHEEAEFGVASHWRYKETENTDDKEVQNSRAKKIDLEWMRELTRWHRRIHDNEAKLEKLKLDVFQNRIFVFTPKGEIIDLPEDATPVDFAYHIHTDVGDHCVSAIINDQITSLDTRLKSGDIIQIKTDKKRKGPSPEWLKFVKTDTARSKIKNKMRVNLGDWLKRMTPTKRP